MYQIIEITQKNTKCTISYDFAWYNSKNLWKNAVDILIGMALNL